MKQNEIIFLDTETTGLNPPKDRLVEIAIISLSGDVLLNILVNPEREIGFATTIHGITDAMVCFEPTFEEIWPKVREIVTGKHLVIYNAQFDTRFFPDNLECAEKISCAMLRFAPIYGEWNSHFNDHKWQKLTTAADFIGYRWEGDAHRALADTMATRALWDWMDNQNSARASVKPRGVHKPSGH